MITSNSRVSFSSPFSLLSILVYWFISTVCIHSDQKGFVKGHNINEANRLMQDVIYYTDREDDDGIIIFLDQQEFVFDLFPVSYIKL
jgi:hypothetical protein